MSAKSDKKLDDKYAKKSTKRKNQLARQSTKRKNQLSKKIAKKDKGEATELYSGAIRDTGTARSEIAAALARVTQADKAQQAANMAQTQAANAALQSQLGNIAQGNDAASMAALSNNGLAAVGNLRSGRTAELNSMIAKLQGQQSESTLSRMGEDSATLGQGYASLNEGAYKQSLQNHLNTRNTSLNTVNRDLGDSYDQSKFDLRETLASNKAALQDQLDQNDLNYQKQKAAERAAAARSIRSGGYGFGGYGLTGGGGGSTQSTPAGPRSSSRPGLTDRRSNAEVAANNLRRFRTKVRGGFWDTNTPEKGLTPWNQTFN